MRLEPFKLERFFARHEFTARYLLSASDCEALSLRELLALAAPESLALWNDLRLAYTESQGHPLLRAEIAGLYETVAPENVMVAVPEEAIFVLMHALLGPHDHAVVITPAYQSLYEVARATGCEVSRVDLTPGPAGWTLDLDRLKSAVNPHTRLIVVNAPHNPTGWLPRREEFDAIVDIARRHDAYLLGDEMYRFLEHDSAARLPAACDVYEKGISLSGLSKSFGLPGLRVGWLAARDTALLERAIAVKDYTTICHSAPSEILAIIALRARDAIVERNRAIVRANLAAMRAFAAMHRDLIHWIEPRGSSVAFPSWKGAEPVEQFCRRALEDRGVLIVPGSLFDYPGQHFRIGMGRRNFEEALRAAASALPSAPSTPPESRSTPPPSSR
jgi:aspartate/methionine/tyrosine aminotransferase